MIFKPFKIHAHSDRKMSIDLLWDVSDEKYFYRLVDVLNIFGLSDKKLVCSCVNNEKINLPRFDDNNVEVNIVEKKINYWK